MYLIWNAKLDHPQGFGPNRLPCCAREKFRDEKINHC